jgi:hypothetical protein
LQKVDLLDRFVRLFEDMSNGKIDMLVKACNLQDNTCAQSLSVLKGRCLTSSRFYFALWMGLSGGSIFKLSSIALAQILKARPR